jgi:hypothetical protein
MISIGDPESGSNSYRVPLICRNNSPCTGMAKEDSTLSDPHDNVEPLDYKEQFKGRRPSEFVE